MHLSIGIEGGDADHPSAPPRHSEEPTLQLHDVGPASPTTHAQSRSIGLWATPRQTRKWRASLPTTGGGHVSSQATRAHTMPLRHHCVDHRLPSCAPTTCRDATASPCDATGIPSSVPLANRSPPQRSKCSLFE
eukprot:UN5096